MLRSSRCEFNYHALREINANDESLWGTGLCFNFFKYIYTLIKRGLNIGRCRVQFSLKLAGYYHRVIVRRREGI